ncbi:unnamed protein product [Euphydryas editha]|uniref:C-type lectin domain-containing protein n=1 Tax=Euphydryas editha TaxID=104508 RepID=A0AAU9UJ84_EUPED|nr:unnamed protein product [Euphydryas editha]
MVRVLVALALLMVSVSSENSTVADVDTSDTCEAFGPWSQALEDWATSPHSDRHGRIMVLPPAKGYYVTERIDTPYLSPPPPPQMSHTPSSEYTSQNQWSIPVNDSYMPQNQGYVPPNQSNIPPNQNYIPPNQGYVPPNQSNIPPNQSYMPQNQGHIPPNQSQFAHKKGLPPPKKSHQTQNNGPSLLTPQSYKEWEVNSPPGAGKIVNKPPNPYKDKVKPNYPVDRVDDPPRKQVTETDLYLLSAIEKLVYRADTMEKRLRKLEDSLYELLAVADNKPEPCASSFVRVGAACYSWGAAADWKRAALACRALGAALAELLDRRQRRALLAKLLADKTLKGDDFWTGGLNPGLLWIWSNSARPVTLDDNNNNTNTNGNNNSTNSANIPGEGRCLSLVYDAARHSYALRGRDCAAPLRYICQASDDRAAVANDIERAARALRALRARPGGRRSKLLWDALGSD